MADEDRDVIASTSAPVENKATKITESSKKRPRSRLACTGCKATKQKCDGPNAERTACRRCTTYGLTCTFPASSSSQAILYAVPPAIAAFSDATTGESNSTGLKEMLQKISARLESIESVLQLTQRRSTDRDPSEESIIDEQHQHKRKRQDPNPIKDEVDEIGEIDDVDRFAVDRPRVTGNPLTDVTEIMGVEYPGAAETGARLDGEVDAISRGIISLDDAQMLFDFFFQKIQPWVASFSLILHGSAETVRETNPLLFHSMLLLASCYAASSSVHDAIHSTFMEIFAVQLISPQGFSTDFLRALDLLNLYKPISRTTNRGGDTMVKSKINGLSSWMFHIILSRTAERLDLADAVDDFHRSYLLMREMGIPITEQVISDLRLYLRLLNDDVVGHVQSGRRCNFVTQFSVASIKVLRLFSTMNFQAYDLRLVAMTELYEVARPVLLMKAYERTRKIARVDLEKFNVMMKEWEEHYSPILVKALPTDPLATVLLTPMSLFVILSFNASVYTAWDKVAELSTWEHECIEKSVRAAEAIIFGLSQESRTGPHPGKREVRWNEAERVGGWRKLVLDESIVESHRWAMDAITCIAYIFPLIFLTKLVNDGLLTFDLVLLHKPTVQPPFVATGKLPRLLELGSAFLQAIAPSIDHPAKKQAILLQSLLESGILGTPLGSHTSRPSTSTGVINNAAWPALDPTYALIQQDQQRQQQQQLRQHHDQVQLQVHQSSGTRIPAAAIDFTLDKLVNLSEFGDGFWEWNNSVNGGAGSESNEPNWSFKL